MDPEALPVAPTLSTQRQLLERLTQLADGCVREEAELRQRFSEGTAAARQEQAQARRQAANGFCAEHSRLIGGSGEVREAVFREYEAAGAALAREELEFHAQESKLLAEYMEQVQTTWKGRSQRIEAKQQMRERSVERELEQFRQECGRRVQTCEALEAEAQKVVLRRCPWPPAGPPATPIPGGLSRRQSLAQHEGMVARASQRLYSLEHEPVSRFLEDGWPVLIFLFTAIATAYPAWMLLSEWGWYCAVLACFVCAVVTALGVRQGLRPLARRRTLRLVPLFQDDVSYARGHLSAALDAAERSANRARQKIVTRRQEKLAAAQTQAEAARSERVALHESRLRQAAQEYLERRRKLEETFELRLAQWEQMYPQKIAQVEAAFEQQLVDLSSSFQTQCAAQRARREREWQMLAEKWGEGLADFRGRLGQMQAYCDTHFPGWPAAAQAAPPALPATSENGAAAVGVASLCFGRYEFDLSALCDVSDDTELEWPRAPFELPAVLSYPECPSLLLEAEGAGREAASSVLRNVMLRLLTSFPAGKVRFTIIDPVGLGQNFSAFMHLADYDERLVSNRIWTEAGHIHQRLADLTEHMENVIQKYLRNEFESILDYNAEAGEVAEPFQILVVANFPANFSEDSARRLASIAQSGARCGVYTLISVDTKMLPPRGFDLADLESRAATLAWDAQAGQFCWKHAEISSLPLALEAPPNDDTFTTLVRAVGQKAQGALRVEVPFSSVTPADGEWWKGDTRSGIDVPLGRAGAKKLQHMRLGKGTSQHVLVAGKTGSGKSTLLNGAITNLALHYAPSELHFYLIDFKKGVEFKAYAALRLPHARVIAIESEREFGLSVLERLDLELKRRGDLFRAHGVQDVAGYRNANPTAELPRILLVIDEFQEFFTSDDKISHDSGLLLDRLIRQGRAFGIHVLLGSQTLAGAYSLARSTLGQMAVRIALQCSEADAHLILSEENTAARLLGRPGEAIYNDANGMFEGNHPFQVVWLPDHERESYLTRVAELAATRQYHSDPPTVFEGNVPADPRENNLLRAALASMPSAVAAGAPRAWLGSAVAIKDPTEAAFRRQSGGNLLIVGQQEEMALGMLQNSILSLAAQLPPRLLGPSNGVDAIAPESENAFQRFYLLNGARPDAPEAGAWQSWKHAQELLGLEVVAPRSAPALVQKLAAEVERRLAAADQTAAPIFLFIYNLARFRDLKRADDFGVGGFGDDAGPGADKQLATILREGPALGVHAVVWCDSYSNANRWFERQTLRDLEMRVLFQMSANDSSNLMDSPAASRLGARLAYFYSEELGLSEKFRPYALPDRDWLAEVEATLARRARDSAAR